MDAADGAGVVLSPVPGTGTAGETVYPQQSAVRGQSRRAALRAEKVSLGMSPANLFEQNGAFVILNLVRHPNERTSDQQPTLKLLAGFNGLLSPAAEQVFFLFIVGCLAGAVSVSGQFHSGLRSHLVTIFLDA